MAKKKSKNKSVETFTHKDETRKNIPTAEYQSLLKNEDLSPVRVAYERRNRDLDPQLVWRGKDEQDLSDLVVQAPPLYIQEKIHPKVLIDDLIKRTKKDKENNEAQFDLFSDFNGLLDEIKRTEFYQHEANWTNRMILGDSLQVMSSLIEREGLSEKVQCIYFDPPYGIKFNSNFQWSTADRNVKDGNINQITREPEQVKAYRDTWRKGIHSYLTYLRDRFIVAHSLLKNSGSIFVQISNDNIHRVRNLLDEIFGDDNIIATITYKKASPETKIIRNSFNYILWYAKDKENVKFNKLFRERRISDGTTEDPKKLALWLRTSTGEERPLTTPEKREEVQLPKGAVVFRADKVRDSGNMEGRDFEFEFKGENLNAGSRHCWRGALDEMTRLKRAGRLLRTQETLAYKYYLSDNWGIEITNLWEDTAGKIPDMRYIVETNQKIVSRCILMSTDPGDLILDPTCGSGTTSFVAEKWGRRWITIDTSRVALALARARIMGARYSYYLLSDSQEGKRKEYELSKREYIEKSTFENINHGFVYKRVPHITLKSIANNTEIDVIWDNWHSKIKEILKKLNETLRNHNKSYKINDGIRNNVEVKFDAPSNSTFTLPSGEKVPLYELLEWEVPKEAPSDWPEKSKKILSDFWDAKNSRQKEIDESITANADHEYLYDIPYEDKSKTRIAGPFTVESLSPHRYLGVNENDELINLAPETNKNYEESSGFVSMILENLKTSGIQQTHKDDKIDFTSINPWPGELICAEGRYIEADSKDNTEKRAGIFIGPEFGTVSRPDLVSAAREASDAGFDVLISCAFSYDAHSSEFNKLGSIPVLKASINADLHMSKELKNTGKGNLFVIFGEPDIDIINEENDKIRVKINGVDVFHPNSGEIRSDSTDGIACWFIDTDYNEESFFVRHAYFLGTEDPYKRLKTSLKSEINKEAWESLYSDISRPFEKPASGRIAVKVINHLGDEVMKVYKV